MNKKLLIPGIAIATLLFGCNKNSSSPVNAATIGATSYTYYSPANHYLEKDTLIYNSSQDLVKISHYDYDSSGGASSVYVDTGSYAFVVNPSTGLPSSYTMLWYKSALGVSEDEIHNLVYDSQNRLIKDTLASNLVSANDAHLVDYYSYSGSNIVGNAYSQGSSDSISYTDTITLNNGNVMRQAAYTGDLSNNFQVEFTTVNGYTTYANPLYNSSLALNIGVLLLDGNLFDALSKQLPADGMAKWTTDANGRVVTVLANNGDIYSYTYR
jgi:hypothetical protein